MPRRISRRATVIALIVVSMLILALLFVYVPGRDRGLELVSPGESPVTAPPAADEAPSINESPVAAIEPASATPPPATATTQPSPTVTLTPTTVLTATPLPTATLPPLGLQGRQNLLALPGDLARRLTCPGRRRSSRPRFRGTPGVWGWRAAAMADASTSG